MITYELFETGKFGNISYPCYIDPVNKTILHSSSQIESILNYRADSCREKIGSKSFKAFVGEGFHVGKISGCKVNNQNSKVVLYPHNPTVAKLISWEASQGNERALQIVDASLLDSPESLLLEQFGIHLSVEERNTRIETYLSKYHPGMDIIKDRWVRDYADSRYITKTGAFTAPQDFMAEANRYINQVLFGVNHFNGNRLKNATTEQLEELEYFYHHLARQAKKKPELDARDLLRFALKTF